MKWIGPCLILSFLSVLAYGQQIPTSVGSPAKPTASPAQVPAGSQPYLHEQTGGVSPAARALTSRPVGNIQEQIEDLKSSLGARQGVIEIPAGAPTGWSDRLGASNVRYLDDRGNSLPDSTGHVGTSGTLDGFKVGFNNALLFRATETDPASPNHYAGYANMQFHYVAAKGGVNNFNGSGTGTKTDYINIFATSEMRTVGQKWGINSVMSSFSGGDTVGIQSYVTQYGGFDTGGDEQTEAIRVQAQQGSATKPDTGGIFEGTVSDMRGNNLTYVPIRDENTIGEHRMIRDLNRVDATGTIVSITNSGTSPNTVVVVGSGTHWSQFGRNAHTQWNNLASFGGVTETDLAFCFDPLKNDGYDMCFPVSTIQDDTHLTLNLLASGGASNTPWSPTWPMSGEYHIYKATWPTSVDTVAHTLTAASLSGFSSGDKIDQVLAYNTDITGEQMLISRHIGLPGQGGGLNIVNFGTVGSPSMFFGVSVSGAFDSAVAMQYSNQRSGVPNYFAHLYSDPGSKVMFDSSSVRVAAPDVALWRLRDSSGTSHTMLHFIRASATACVLDSSLCVSAKGAIAASQLNQTQTSNYAGTITISNELTASISFKQPYKTIPTCTLTPTSDPTEVGPYWVSVTPTSITANVKQRGRISFTYICVGNPG